MSDSRDALGEGETVYATPAEQQGTKNNQDSGTPLHQDREWLYHQYHVLNKSCREIAEQTEVSRRTISRNLEKNDIDTRSRAESLSILRIGNNPVKNKDWLETKYIDEELTMEEIAELADVSYGTVRNYLKKHDIEISYDNRGGGNIAAATSIGKEIDLKYRDRKWLEHKYWAELLSTRDIAELCNVSPSAVHKWLDRHGIETRSNSQACKLREANAKAKVEKNGKRREVVVRDKDTGGPIIDASWQYFHERPVKQ